LPEGYRERRRWADVVLIVVGLSLFGLAVWFPPFSTTDEAPQAISLWPNYALAGGLILAALLLGQRWDWLWVSRLMLLAAVVVLIIGLFRVRASGMVPWLTMIIPGIAVLLATPFFGPMPRAAEDPSAARGSTSRRA
jgi:peptidoglycan/LPS O-acetylase OafA/YrhL